MAPQFTHVRGCATDEMAREVCEGLYWDRTRDNLALCEALRAVYALAGQDKQIAKIIQDALREHGVGNG
jgi:hypothetical protein